MALQRILTQDQNLQLIQDNVGKALTPLENIPMVGGAVLTDIVLTSAQDNLIRHGLNHRPQYFIVLKVQVDTRIWSPNSTSLDNANANATYLNLRCSTTCTVSVWVN